MRKRAQAAAIIVRLTLILGLLGGSIGLVTRTRAVGQPLYPDLRTLPPAGLYLQTAYLGDGRLHWLLRFDNTMANYGGPLELEANPDNGRDVYQNVYDATVGGSRAAHLRITGSLIFHPEHNHFHFQDLASYVLLKKDTKGIYRQTSRRGSKTSVCVFDVQRITSSIGPGSPRYDGCDRHTQGLSAGWADVYSAELEGQWIDMGTSRPADGDYAVQSTADPKNRIRETDDTNNTGTRYILIRNGAVQSGVPQPTCTTTPNTGPVGTQTALYCAKMPAGATIDVRWGGPSTRVLATTTVKSDGTARASIVIPASTAGNHFVYATNRASNHSALAWFNTTASLAVAPSSGIVGRQIELTARGFAAGEQVTFRFFTVGSTSVAVATVAADSKGTAVGTATIPVSVFGAHQIEAIGSETRSSALASVSVTPSMQLIPSAVAAGERAAPSLRGFKKYETVTLRLTSDNRVLGTVRTSSTGSVTANAGNAFTIPADLAAGQYTVVATGSLSGVPVNAALTVTAAVIAAEPATATPSPTPSPPEVPTSTPEPAQTETPVPEGSPVVEIPMENA